MARSHAHQSREALSERDNTLDIFDITLRDHDGDNLLPFLKGDEKQSPRKRFLYWSDDGDLLAIRVGNWKATFLEREHTGLGVWQKGFTNLR